MAGPVVGRGSASIIKFNSEKIGGCEKSSILIVFL